MAETDMYNKQMSLFDEGGMADDGMDVDPVSGNEVPPGSMSEEVRDDVDAKLSSGEYVVPADVVQYFGLKFFENLRNEAKGDLEKMDKDGRIGGAPSKEAPMGGEEELSPEEMAMLEEIMGGGGQEAPVQMAEGGLTTGYTPSPSTFKPKDWAAVGGSLGLSGSNTSTSSGRIVYKTYVGPSGETQLIMFINGKPNTPIPEGFTLKETAAEKSQEKTQEEIEAEELQAMELANRGPAEEGNDEPSESFAEANFDALSKDPNAIGMSTLGKDTIGDTIAGNAPGIAGGIVGGVNAAQNVAAVAAANASSRIGKDQGKDMSALDDAINEAKAGWGLAEKGLDAIFGSDGDRIYNDYQEGLKSKAEAKQVAKEVSKTPTTPAKSDTTPAATPSSTPDDDDSAGSTGGSRSGGLGGGEFNKGGLVKKRTTKKTTTTKKTQPKKKGLASK